MAGRGALAAVGAILVAQQPLTVKAAVASTPAQPTPSPQEILQNFVNAYELTPWWILAILSAVVTFSLLVALEPDGPHGVTASDAAAPLAAATTMPPTTPGVAAQEAQYLASDVAETVGPRRRTTSRSVPRRPRPLASKSGQVQDQEEAEEKAYAGARPRTAGKSKIPPPSKTPRRGRSVSKAAAATSASPPDEATEKTSPRETVRSTKKPRAQTGTMKKAAATSTRKSITKSAKKTSSATTPTTAKDEEESSTSPESSPSVAPRAGARRRTTSRPATQRRRAGRSTTRQDDEESTRRSGRVRRKPRVFSPSKYE